MKRKHQWIGAFAAVACLLGGIWMWDAADYPMPGVPPASPNPFAMQIWEKGDSLMTILSRTQERLRTKRYNRLKEKWRRELEIVDTQWAIVPFFANASSFVTKSEEISTVHFRMNGDILIEKPSDHIIERYRSYEFSDRKELIFYSQDNTTIPIEIHFPEVDVIELSESGQPRVIFAVLKRVSESTDGR